MTDLGHSVQILFISVCLLWCSVSDLFERRIPNRVVLLILLGWAGTSIWQVSIAGVPIVVILYDLLGSGLVFIVGFLLFLTGRLGAGDVKLMGVLCLWVGYGQQMFFVMVTALVGGFLALALPLLNMLPFIFGTGISFINEKLKTQIALPPVLSRELSQGIPYGIAISSGAAYIMIWPYI
ncbi:A24 family peptidase (plasmid) [Klebsiella sp. WOUb02]|uniref:A24 family peptidase n=1 Tax=Klebsiella sp. WOUb02 TaxID=3161071 RepID=UPI003CEB8613